MKYNNSLRNKIKLLRKRPAHRLRIFLKYVFRRQKADPVFVIATRRSGSNLLLSCLNSVPGVSFASEVLNQSMFYGLRSRFIGKQAVLRHIAYSLNDCGGRICGAKLLKIQLRTHQLTLETLKKHFPSARFIILRRESVLNQFISLKIAQQTDVWLCRNHESQPEHPPVYLDREEFLAYREDYRSFYEDISSKKWLAECSVSLTYEQLAEDAQKVFDEVLFPFLGLPRTPVKSTIRKQNIKPVHELIQNPEDFRDMISGPEKFPSETPAAVYLTA